MKSAGITGSTGDRQKNTTTAGHVAAAGMALALCMISLMLFRGMLSLLQALIIPIVLVLLEAVFVSGLHMGFLLFCRRRLDRVVGQDVR